MFLTDKTPRWFWQLGSLLFAIQVFIFVFGTPHFQVGFWNRQEPRLVAIFLFSAFTSMWLGYGSFKKWIVFDGRIPTLFWLILAWTGWQIIVTFLAATSAWRSWFGSVDYGDGAGLSVSLTIVTTLAYLLLRHTLYKKFIVFSSISALITLYILEIGLGRLSPWSPFGWPDYLALSIGWVWLIFHMCYPTITKSSQFKLNLAALLALLLTQNKSAIVFFICAFFVSQIVLEICQKRGINCLPVRLATRKIACAITLLPLIYIMLSYNPLFFHNKYQDSGSLPTRMHMISIGLQAISDEPSRLLLGKGWNNFQNDYTHYATIDSVKIFQNGEINPNIDSVFGGAKHSHNQPLEALLSLGIVGLGLWFALSFTIILRMPEALFWRVIPLYVAMVYISYFWFSLSFLYAFQALFWAVALHVMSQEKYSHVAPSKPERKIVLAMISISFVLLWSSADAFRAMYYSQWLMNAIREPYKNYLMEDILEDGPRGGERFQGIIYDLMIQIATTAQYRAVLEKKAANQPLDLEESRYLLPKYKPLPLPADVHRWVERLLSAGFLINTYNASDNSVATTDAHIQFTLQTKDLGPEFNRARADSFMMYPATVVRLARLAPLREDLAAPYLYQLEKDNDEATLSLVLARLLDANPNHRSALWLTGKIFAKTPATQTEGLALMRQALDAGAADIYPITDKEAAEIRTE